MKLVLKQEMEIVFSSSVMLGIPPLLLRHNYFMFNHWWIPYSLMGVSSDDSLSVGLAESAYEVCWCVQFCPFCHLRLHKLSDLGLLSLSIPPPTWCQVCQLLAYPTIHCHSLGNSFVVRVMVVWSLLVMCCISHVGFSKIVKFWQLVTQLPRVRGCIKHNMLARLVSGHRV